MGCGVESHALSTYRTSVTLAERLGAAFVDDLPGEHTGFVDHPTEFAEALRVVLR
ncbi:hypothetical protein Van01_64500 [Micromonospora andamanensis]|uniref:Alpha/beta hydrolase n=1 Tax=Micromonospora andamanensis TaxID=1287068 RepID=A0ABQ4I622_9ACTN|nr:hypothetical protein Van01_64500 [Micromonospora andamanensis]